MKTIGVIPARWGSTRFEGKVLAQISGQPMIRYVWEQAKKAKVLDEVLIACDDQRVLKAAQGFKAKAVMTALHHTCGTDRIAEAVAKRDVEVVVNIQADEPLIEPEVIDSLAKALLDDKTAVMATVIKALTDEKDLDNPNVVKVVVDRQKNALYFSRYAIPYNRDKKGFKEIKYFKHLGLYAYRKDFLMKFKDLPASKLEASEKLEQLRVLEAGFKIKTVETKYDTIGVDTPQDLARVEELMGKKK
jgi:3-deoxy-manno-octulosonate cytidylyltransferase (CMP-KDO synthetase)